MNKEASLKQAGRHIGDAIDAEADCVVTPCPLCHLNLDLQQPLAAKSSGARSGCRCCTCRSSSASRSGSSRRSSGINQHVVKPTSVIDWSTSVVAGVGRPERRPHNEKEGAPRALFSARTPVDVLWKAVYRACPKPCNHLGPDRDRPRASV